MSETKKSFKTYIIIFWSIVALGLVSAFLLFFLIAKGNLGFMPSFKELENPQNILATEIYFEDGPSIDKYFNQFKTHLYS